MKIAVLSGKGGVGKSMLTSGLATLLSQEKQIIALDCDADTPSLALWLGIAPDIKKGEKISTVKKPVIDKNKCIHCNLCVNKCPFNAIAKGPEIKLYLCEGCGLCAYICPQKAITLQKRVNGYITKEKTKFGFEVLSAHLIPGETGSGDIVNAIKIKAEKKPYEILISDSAAGIGCPVIASINGMDLAIGITEPSLAGISDLKRALKLADHFHIPYLIVINKWDLSPGNTKQLELEYKNKVIGKITYDSKIFKHIAQMKPVMESDLLAKKEIEAIFYNLKSYIFT
jgi:MinD superfamily P-loop ATPase